MEVARLVERGLRESRAVDLEALVVLAGGCRLGRRGCARRAAGPLGVGSGACLRALGPCTACGQAARAARRRAGEP